MGGKTGGRKIPKLVFFPLPPKLPPLPVSASSSALVPLLPLPASFSSSSSALVPLPLPPPSATLNAVMEGAMQLLQMNVVKANKEQEAKLKEQSLEIAALRTQVEELEAQVMRKETTLVKKEEELKAAKEGRSAADWELIGHFTADAARHTAILTDVVGVMSHILEERNTTPPVFYLDNPDHPAADAALFANTRAQYFHHAWIRLLGNYKREVEINEDRYGKPSAIVKDAKKEKKEKKSRRQKP